MDGVGRGFVLRSLGCVWIDCPNSRAKIPVFDANLSVCLCIILRIQYPKAK